MANDISTLSPDMLQNRADATRLELTQSIAAFRGSVAPASLGKHLVDAATETTADVTDTVANAARSHPVSATAGAVSLGLLAAGILWRATSRHSIQGGTSQDKLPNELHAKRNVTSTGPTKSTDTPPPATPAGQPLSQAAPKPSRPSADTLGDLFDIGPKLALALAAGYILERRLPRSKGELDIWNDIRDWAVPALKSARGKAVQAASSHPGNPLPLLGLAAIAVRAFARR